MSKTVLLSVVLVVVATICGVKFAFAIPAPVECDTACSDVRLAVVCESKPTCLLFSLPDCSTCKGNGNCRYRAPTPNPANNICRPDPLVNTVNVHTVDCDEDCLCQGMTTYAEGKNWSHLGIWATLPRHTCPFNLVQPTQPLDSP